MQAEDDSDEEHQLVQAQLHRGSPGSSPRPGRLGKVQLHQFGPVGVQWESHQPGHGGLLLHQLHQEGNARRLTVRLRATSPL